MKFDLDYFLICYILSKMTLNVATSIIWLRKRKTSNKNSKLKAWKIFTVQPLRFYMVTPCFFFFFIFLQNHRRFTMIKNKKKKNKNNCISYFIKCNSRHIHFVEEALLKGKLFFVLLDMYIMLETLE